MGTIFQRTEGGSWYIKYYDPSKRYTRTECVNSRKYKDAVKALRARETAKDNEEPIIPRSRITVNQLLDMVLADLKNNDRSSWKNVEQKLDKHLRPAFGTRKAISITFTDVESYKSKRKTEGAANSTINRELSYLRKAFTLGMKDKKVLSIPAIQKLEENNVREGFLEVSEYLKILTFLKPPIRPVFELAYLIGMRKAALLSILWKNVDRTRGILTLEAKKAKNREMYRLYYGKNPEIVDLIEQQWQRKIEIERKTDRDVSHLFFRKNGNPIKDFRGAWESACIKAGFTPGRKPDGKIFHDTRRSASRNMRLAGISETEAMKITGHKTRSVFERYNVITEADLEEVTAKIGVANKIEYFSSTLTKNEACKKPETAVNLPHIPTRTV